MVGKNCLFWLCALSIVGYSSCDSAPENLRLELVQVVFRHGERAPQSDELSLMDKVDDHLEGPWGYGQLTNRGKLQEYRLGEMLRERYGEFLNGTYKPEQVYAYSSNFDRTKMSLQLVLASLFPPTPELTWNKDLNWMPIPIHYLPKKLDPFFYLDTCPKYDYLYKQLLESKRFKICFKKYRSLFEYLKSWYPEKEFDFQQLFSLNTLINIQIAQNATLPDWYNAHVHRKITKGAKIYIDSVSGTPSLARMTGGPLVRRMLENVEVKMNNVNERKIHLFSGHEFTVYAVAKAHNVTLNHSPAFSSAILHETHKDDRGNAFVKMFYWSGVTQELHRLYLPGCDELCPVRDYAELLRPVLPSDEQLRCLYNNLTPVDLQNIVMNDKTVLQHSTV